MAIVIVSFKLLSFYFYYFLLLLIITIISQVKAQPNFLGNYCINDTGIYTTNSTYQNNLNILLFNLSTNTQINYGFYNFSYGQNTDKVNAIGLCRGDVKPDICRNCLNDSRVLLTRLCPNQKEAIGWYDYCMLRYSDRSIFGIMEQLPWFPMENGQSVTEVDPFNRVLGNLMKKLKEKAASSNDSRVKYATDKESDVSLNFQTIYGLVQCTPDLSLQDCLDCLNGAIAYLPVSKYGGRVIEPSCNIRYESWRFYDPPLVVDPDDTSQPQEKSRSSSHTTTIAIGVSTVVVVVVLLTLIICICLRRNRHSMARLNLEGQEKNDEFEAEASKDLKVGDLLQFDMETVKLATSNFSDANKLGQGGFGTVYKGMLANGQNVAIKRLAINSNQGETEFKNEVLLTGKLQHRNLVKLLGFCLQRKERLLIYEFVPNKSLDYIIFDPIKRTNLNWERRYKIIKDIARGLVYLHEDSRLQIIHRDLKISNILLDEEMNPKITDFGIAKLFDASQTHGMTKTVVGTFGYMAPEYVRHGKFSIKSDVFSYGIIILEIVCGRRIIKNRDGEFIEDLLSIAWRNWKAGTISDIIDPLLDHGCNKNEKLRCIHVGLLCVQEDIDMRPAMSLVLLMLSSIYFPLPEPLAPPLLMQPKRTLSKVLSDQYSGLTKSTDPGSTTKYSVTD